MIYPIDSLIQCINHFTLDKYFQNLLSNPVDSGLPIVSLEAVFWDVTQRSPERNGGALLDIPKDGCEGDYLFNSDPLNN